METLTESRKQTRRPQLIDAATLQLHTVHNMFQNEALKSSWNILKVLKTIWQTFHKSSARQEDNINISIIGSETFPLTFYTTSWDVGREKLDSYQCFKV